MKGNQVTNIIEFNGQTLLDLPADTILSKAIGNLDCVVIAGKDKEGNEYFASSMADGGDCLWYLERCKKILLEDIPDE